MIYFLWGVCTGLGIAFAVLVCWFALADTKTVLDRKRSAWPREDEPL